MKVTTLEHAKKQGRFEMQSASKVVKDIGLGTATQDPGGALHLLKHHERRRSVRLCGGVNTAPPGAVERRCERFVGGDDRERSACGRPDRFRLGVDRQGRRHRRPG